MKTAIQKKKLHSARTVLQTAWAMFTYCLHLPGKKGQWVHRYLDLSGQLNDHYQHSRVGVSLNHPSMKFLPNKIWWTWINLGDALDSYFCKYLLSPNNHQHSFLLCIVSKATWRTKRALTTKASGWWLGAMPALAAILACSPCYNSFVKGSRLDIEFETHIVANTITHPRDCNHSSGVHCELQWLIHLFPSWLIWNAKE